MKHDEERDEECRDQHEGQPCHRGRRYAAGKSWDDSRTQPTERDGNRQVQDPQEIPDDESPAVRKTGSADQGKHHLVFPTKRVRS